MIDFGKNVTKFYVTNWEGMVMVGLDPNMYDVTLLDLFFFEGFPNPNWLLCYLVDMYLDNLLP